MSKLNLKPIEEMLNDVIGSEEVAEVLDNIAYTYARCALRTDCDETAVSEDLWYLRMLRNRFLKITNPNQIFSE